MEGQTDSAAANAYLDAFAASKRGARGPRVVSLGWGRWDGVGLADLHPKSDGLPFLGRGTGTSDQRRFVSRKSPDSHWILDDHRLASGESVLPGTGYLQLFASAACKPNSGTLTLQNIEFVSPLRAQGSEVVAFTTTASAGSLEVESRAGVHARAEIADHASTVLLDPWAPSPAANVQRASE